MGKIIYDFREGLDQEKIVYKNVGTNWKEGIYYLGYLFLTWGWAIGWFALFQYAYIYNEPTAFWTYIGIWLAFIIAMLAVIIYNLAVYYKSKALKQKNLEVEEAKKLEKERIERENRESKKKEPERQIQHDVVMTTQNNERDKLNQ